MKINYVVLLIISICTTPSVTFSQNKEDLKALEFGITSDRAIVGSQMVVFDESANQRIEEIGMRVVRASERPDMNYKFRIISDPIINAYATSGGFVYVTTGLLDILESEDELASVLGHEIAHSGKNHTYKFVQGARSRKTLSSIVGNAFGVLIGAAFITAMESMGTSSTTTYYSTYNSQAIFDVGLAMSTAISQKVGTAMAIAMIQGYGKKQELEADALAVHYTHRAGYDPYAMIRLFKRLKSFRDRLEVNAEDYFSSLINAKPGLEERIAQIEKLIKENE